MTTPRHDQMRTTTLLLAFTALIAFASPTMAQEESVPSQASEEMIGDPAEEAPEEGPIKIEPPQNPVDDSEDLVNLNLNKQDVSEIIEFIVRWTGKVVMVQE